MGTNLSHALAELDFLSQHIYKQVQDIEKEFVEDIFDILTGPPMKGTPVDTGWASANWIVSVNSPVSGSVADTGNVSGAKGVSEDSLANLMSMDLRNISSIFITNRVSYIDLLNNGTHSKKAIPMFVESAVQDGRTLLKSKRIR